MLQTIPIYTSILFAVLYPLCFWITHPDPIITGFRRFNLGLSCFVGGLGLFGLMFLELPNSVKHSALIWFGFLFFTSAFLWNKKNINPHLLTVSSILGILLVGKLQGLLVSLPANKIWSPLLGGAILASIVYTTVLGHWYLNIQGLALSHFLKATKIFWGLIILRTVFDIFLIFKSSLLHLGDQIPLYQFLLRMDGFLLPVALVFGTFFPLLTTGFALGSLKVKNTQSATGILYAILVSVFMGDLAYKYYFFKYGIAL